MSEGSDEIGKRETGNGKRRTVDGRRSTPSWLRMGLGRPMDFRLLSNRVAVAAPLLAGAVAGVWSLVAGLGFVEAVRWGVFAGGASFLAWATGRELDPARPMSANVAAVLAPWLVLWALPALAAGGLWLLALRAVAGTVGAGPYRFDMLLVGGLAIWAAVGDRGLVAAIAGLIVVAFSTVFERRGRSTVLYGGVVTSALLVVVAIVGEARQAPQAITVDTLLWLAAIAVVASTALLGRVRGTTDRRPRPLSPARIRWGVAGAACWGALAVLWHGPVGVAVAGPALTALATTGASALVRRGP